MTERELPANGAAAELLRFQAPAAGEHVPAGHDPKIIQLGNVGKNHEAAQVVFIRAPRL
jgi:hypothetical protein